MAGMNRGWTKQLCAGVLLIAALRAVLAQSADRGALSGKLTDLYSAPLAGVTVVLRNQATGVEARVITEKNGAYRFSGLDPGEYTLDAESPQSGYGHVERIQVSAGFEARVRTAIEFGPPAARPQQPVPSSGYPSLATEPQKPSPALQQETTLLEDESLMRLAIRGRGSEERLRPPPQSEAVALNDSLPPVPLQLLALGSRSLAPPAIPHPAPFKLPAAKPDGTAGQPVLVSTGASVEGGGGLNALGQSWGGGQGFALGMAAISVLRAAMEDWQPAPRSVLVASHPIEPASPVVTTTIQGEQLQALPVSGRRWQDFVFDTPTASVPAGSDGQPLLHGSGQEPPATEVDGLSRGLAFGSDSANRTRSRGLSISDLAIREVQTAAGNAEASADRAAGGRVNVVTQRGSNGLHGQGFLFDRQNTWGAQNPFTQWVKETAPATLTTTPVFTPIPYTPPDHETAWGIGVGSRIRRDKLFWFAALDSYRRNDPGLATVKHSSEFFAQPSNDQMQVLSARLGLSSANPVAEGLAAYSSDAGNPRRPARPRSAHRRAVDRLCPHRLGGSRAPPLHAGRNWRALGFARRRPDPRIRDLRQPQLRVEPGQRAVAAGPLGGVPHPQPAGRDPGLRRAQHPERARPRRPRLTSRRSTSNVWGQLPQMVVDSRYGFTIGNPSRFGAGSYPDEHLYQAQETVDWVRGSLLRQSGLRLESQ